MAYAYTVSFPAGSEGKMTLGNKKVRLCDVTMTGTYATGGITLTPTDFGVQRIVAVIGNSTEASGQTSSWQVHWDATNNKLKLFGLAAAATGQTEHGAISFAASSVAHLLVIGR